jgi:branched-chain amino acid transport system permease protein
MLGAMMAFFASSKMDIGYWGTLVFVVSAFVGIGILLYELLLRFMEGEEFDRTVLMTLGLSMVLQNGAIFLWSTKPRMVTTEYSYLCFDIGEIKVGLARVLIMIISVCAFALLYFVLKKTRIGKAMRGVSQNREAALLVGITPRNISRIAVAIGIAMTALAGATVAPIYCVHPLMGFAFIFKVFAIVIIGGLGSLEGSVIAAIMVGVLEGVVGGFLPLVVSDLIAFLFMILVLLIRPKGLLGRGVRV